MSKLNCGFFGAAIMLGALDGYKEAETSAMATEDAGVSFVGRVLALHVGNVFAGVPSLKTECLI